MGPMLTPGTLPSGTIGNKRQLHSDKNYPRWHRLPRWHIDCLVIIGDTALEIMQSCTKPLICCTGWPHLVLTWVFLSSNKEPSVHVHRLQKVYERFCLRRIRPLWCDYFNRSLSENPCNLPNWFCFKGYIPYCWYQEMMAIWFSGTMYVCLLNKPNELYKS